MDSTDLFLWSADSPRGFSQLFFCFRTFASNYSFGSLLRWIHKPLLRRNENPLASGGSFDHGMVPEGPSGVLQLVLDRNASVLVAMLEEFSPNNMRYTQIDGTSPLV